jgi:hypothetical protein
VAEIEGIVNAGSAGKCTDAADLDGDGVLNDVCPTSDLRATVVLNTCDSTVANALFPSGCTLADVLSECQGGPPSKVARCIARLGDKLRGLDILTPAQVAALADCGQ